MSGDANQFQWGPFESEAAVKHSASSGRLLCRRAQELSPQGNPQASLQISTKGSECSKQGGNREPRERANAQGVGRLVEEATLELVLEGLVQA